MARVAADRAAHELRSAMEALAGGEHSRRVVPSGSPELRQLAGAFNAMASALAHSREAVDADRRRLAATIEHLGVGVIVTEPGGTRVAAFNRRAGELMPELKLGAPLEGTIGSLPPLGDALGSEIVMEHRDHWLGVSAAHLGAADAGVVWTVRDLTERIQLERTKTEFVAMVSHELRSPLTSIKGFVELLDRSAENLTDRQREFVEIILRSTDRLVELVGDLLDVARLEADRVEIDRQPIDVGEAVREVVELMRPRLEDKRQQLGVYVAPTLPLALADASRVRQIVANLLTNAHLYTPEQGRIHVGVEGQRAWVQIVVADSGIGLTEEERQRVFERFYRAEGGRAAPGTGLGLAIVKSLVELHDGRVEVDSQPGHGATFKVLLPATAAEPESARGLQAIGGRRVLVVDDERDVAELVAGQLAPLGVTVDIVTHGRAALARLREARYDAVTLDILMPEQDGFEVLRKIRADPRLCQIPVVFVSVFSDRRELAGEWVVPKPIDADELREVLGAAVRSGRSRVLVVAREELQAVLEPALDELGIEHTWELSGAAAARVCGERRFEVALVDVGIRNPHAALQALDLRGRRLRRAVILFSDGSTPTPPGLNRLGIEVVSVQQAPGAVLASLRGAPVA